MKSKDLTKVTSDSGMAQARVAELESVEKITVLQHKEQLDE